jgi:uncharacterized protein YlxW (UPF0749 family)
MMNIKNIFITTSISVFFGIYSVYNLFVFVNTLNNIHIKNMADSDKKYSELNNSYSELNNSYSELNNSYSELTKSYSELDNKYNELLRDVEKNNMLNDDNMVNDDNISIIISSHGDSNDKIENSNLSSDILKYELYNYDNFDKGSIHSEKRVSSNIEDIDWYSISKKFIFGL